MVGLLSFSTLPLLKAQSCGNDEKYHLPVSYTHLQGVGGAKALYVGKYMLLSDVEGNFNRSSEIWNSWSPTNTGSDIPRLSKNDPNGNFTTASDWYLENASYLRLKNVTLSYDLSCLLYTSRCV